MKNTELQEIARQVRKDILWEIFSAQSGHPGGSLSAADIGTVLYFDEMDITKKNAKGRKRDRMVFSKGHASPLLYALLCEKGIIEKDDLTTFRRINTRLQGHPNMQYVDGIDMSTGSLGQGISAAVGMAIANRLDCNSHRIYALLGDGECQEGEVWEALMSATHYHLDNLCVIIDHNGLQIDGKVADVMNVDSLDEKVKAFGCHVLHINGHDIEAIKAAFAQARTFKQKPTVIIADTIKGKGVSFMENDAGWHGKAPNARQFEQAIKDLGGDAQW